jgi:hypothetical protein
VKQTDGTEYDTGDQGWTIEALDRNQWRSIAEAVLIQVGLQ